MGFSIDPSIYGALIQRSLMLNNTAMSQSITRLSTGLRINSAADDPAGLTISNVLQSQVSGLNQSVRNAQDGISLIQTASGALQTTSTILQNMQTLATQAATGTYSATDVANMQAQMNQYAAQITNSVNNTTYNGKNLLAGAMQNLQLQIGANPGQSVGVSIGAMDAASLGVAGSSASIVQGSNTANINTLANVGTGLQGANTGEQYQVRATGITTTTAATYTTAGVASTSASAAQNAGSETLGLAFSGGVYGGGTNQNYVAQVTSVNSQGVITGIKYAQANTGASGTLGSWTNATLSTASILPNGNAQSVFTLNNNIQATLTSGAATAQVGDTFTFTANTANTFTNQQSGTNQSQATGVIGGTYSGTTNVAYGVRATLVDSNNNVVGIQVSTDAGKTWGSTLTTTTGGYNGTSVPTAGAANTATTFANIGNGLSFTWTPGGSSSFLNSQAAANNDTLSFNAVAANQNVQFLQLADTTQVGGVARYTGAAANIGSGLMLNAGQTTAGLGIGNQQITAAFAAPGTAGGIQNGTTTFSVATPQAAMVAGGNVLAGATAPAGINIATTTTAGNALAAIQNAISQVSAQQGQLGALQNRLTQSVSVMTNTSQNLATSNAQITTADIAQETINLTRARIIQQSAIALLAQTNQSASLALKLLG